MQSKANKWPPFGSAGWILIPSEKPDETPPGFHLRWNVFFIWDQTFLIVSFEKTCKKLGLRASSRVPNTARPRAFICFSVFRTRDEARSPNFWHITSTIGAEVNLSWLWRRLPLRLSKCLLVTNAADSPSQDDLMVGGHFIEDLQKVVRNLKSL